jgi:hypothetical protein
MIFSRNPLLSESSIARFGQRLSPRRLAGRLHRDERGALSVMGVWTIFLLTILLGMVFNVGRHIDDKLRMQNAADAAAYSGTLTLTRGMNAEAYSNHLLCEVFALTAYMREGNQRYAERFTPDALAEWRDAAEAMQQASAGLFPKFTHLAGAILDKVGPDPQQLGQMLQQDRQLGPQHDLPGSSDQILGLEGALVRHFGNMTAMHADLTLSIFEFLLRGADGTFPVDNQNVPQDAFEGGPITLFQRAVVEMTPGMAQLAASEIARRHGAGFVRQHRGRPLEATLYRWDGSRVDDYRENDRFVRTLPVINPTAQGGDVFVATDQLDTLQQMAPHQLSADERYFIVARNTRDNLARHYLELWIRTWADEYFTERPRGPRLGRFQGSLSQLANFWRIFTCAQLRKLLEEEFPRSNLPFMIRGEETQNWRNDGDSFPYNHANTYLRPNQEALETEYNFVAVVSWPHLREFAEGVFQSPLGSRSGLGGAPAVAFAQAGMFLPARRLHCCPWEIPIMTNQMGLDDSISTVETGNFYLNADLWPSSRRSWSLFNQNWRTRMVPVTNRNLVEILLDQNVPLHGVYLEQVRQINMH